MIQLGGLLVAAALLSRAGFFSALLPGEPPTTTDTKYGLDEPGTLSFSEWQKQIEPGGSYLDYQDYLAGK